MKTKFIFLGEDTKYWIISSIVALAIFLLISISGFENDGLPDSETPDHGSVRYYSKILGIDPPDRFWPGEGYLAGNPVFAADVR